MLYRFSGHETFPCRYTWLPKAVVALQEAPHLFKDIDEAMVVLGVGKNMVRAIRFWVGAAKVAEPRGKGELVVSQLGKMLLCEERLDPYLEDTQTLWLIHWNFSTHTESPIFAWDFLMNQWQEPEITPSLVIRDFEKGAVSQGRKLSQVTLKQHFDVFLHTYVPTRGSKGSVLEDNLDCPLIELDLIRQIGESVLDRQNGKREPVYAFNRDPKPQISQPLFIFCLNDFWTTYHPKENTLSFREVASGHGSPGQIFKLPEREIRDRLENIENSTNGAISFHESVNLQQIQKHEDVEWENLLNAVYHPEES